MPSHAVFLVTIVVHLMEEERDIPPLIRAHFTEPEYHAMVQDVAKKVSLTEVRFTVAAVVDSVRDWMTPDALQEFMNDIPSAFVHLIDKYYLPDYYHYVRPMRDAPTLATKPKLKRVGCCGIPFCFPCII